MSVGLCAQHFGGDHRHRGVRTLAHVGQADEQRHAAVIDDLDEGGRGVVLEHALGARGHRTDADADALERRQLAVLALPARLLRGLRDALGQTTAAEESAGHAGVTLGHAIQQMEVDRIHAQLTRQRIHVLTEAKGHLRQATAVMEVVRDVVGVHQPAAVAGRLDLVQRVDIGTGERQHDHLRFDVGTGIETDVRFEGLDPASLRHAGTEGVFHLATGTTGDELLVCRGTDLHRPAGLARQHGRDIVMRAHRGTAGKTATGVQVHDAHLAIAQPQRTGQALLEQDRGLGGRVHRQLVGQRPVGDRHMKLGITVVRGVGRVTVGAHTRRTGKGLLDIAEILRLLPGDIAFGLGVDQEGIGLLRILDAEQRRQRLVLHLDQRGSFGCRRLIERGNGGDFVADVVDDLVAEQRLLDAHVELRGIGMGDHRLDARQGQRSRGVDAQDPRARMRTAHDLRVQHAGQHHVVGEQRAAAELVRAIQPGLVVPDDGEIAFLSHRAPPPLQPWPPSP